MIQPHMEVYEFDIPIEHRLQQQDVILLRVCQHGENWRYEFWKEFYHHKLRRTVKHKNGDGVGFFATPDEAIKAGMHHSAAWRAMFDRYDELRVQLKEKQISRYRYKKLVKEAEESYPTKLRCYAAVHSSKV